MVPSTAVDKLNQAPPYSLHRSTRGRKLGGVGAEFGVDSLFAALEVWGSSPPFGRSFVASLLLTVWRVLRGGCVKC